MAETASGTISVCAQCGCELAPSALNCPQCHSLVHAERLKTLAAQAESAAQAGQLTEALTHWRAALDLLPPESKQHEVITEKVVGLSKQLDEGGGAPASGTGKKLASWGVVGAIFLFLVTKGKFLLMGLSKSGTVFSMLAAFGVYWTLWGWKFALGFVIAIYIHEMGHVAALIRYGIPASAPMFIPGLGAFVRIKQYPASPQEDAYVGLAGPIWGLGATLIAFGIYHATGDPLYAAIAHVSAIVNVFNLMPIAGLDGDRGFRALTQGQRILATLVIAGMWYYTREGLMILVLIVAAARALFGKGAETLDHRTLAKFILLTVSLSLLGMWSIVKHAGTPGAAQ